MAMLRGHCHAAGREVVNQHGLRPSNRGEFQHDQPGSAWRTADGFDLKNRERTNAHRDAREYCRGPCKRVALNTRSPRVRQKTLKGDCQGHADRCPEGRAPVIELASLLQKIPRREGKSEPRSAVSLWTPSTLKETEAIVPNRRLAAHKLCMSDRRKAKLPLGSA
ncbi:hypothetical protein BV20DRAFT_968848 [Pilatotrama ljubarskyi]|nr:hypothetical protein BV20DRAFT_968848 [Pilatotrama ljubarskyi]